MTQEQQVVIDHMPAVILSLNSLQFFIKVLKTWNSLPVLEINFVLYWPSGHLSQILTGQTVSFTGHVQEQLNLNDKRVC